MALRLLQLCTGDQPYRASEETVWRELKKALGSVSIRCSGLSGATSVEWEVDSSLWPAEPVRSFDLIGDGDRPGICRSVTIDGQAADLTEVQELLRVHRLAGDETLAEAILADVSDLKAIAESERAVTNLHRGQAGGVLDCSTTFLRRPPQKPFRTRSRLLRRQRRNATSLKSVSRKSPRDTKAKRICERRVELSSLLEKHDDPEAHAGQLEDQLDDLRKQQELLSESGTDSISM